MTTKIMLSTAQAQVDYASNGPVSYLIGGIIALMILGYLVYILLHPEKF
jgi:K+-transporting ATPase KdpF subunit